MVLLIFTILKYNGMERNLAFGVSVSNNKNTKNNIIMLMFHKKEVRKF